MNAVYLAKDITETTQHWKRSGQPIIKLAALSTLFESHLKENMVVVNVNGKAHFTHLGLVTLHSQTFESFTKISNFPFA